MNWYKVSQQEQQRFPFMDNISQYRAKSNMPASNMDEIEWDDALEEVSNETELMHVCKHYGIKAKKNRF